MNFKGILQESRRYNSPLEELWGHFLAEKAEAVYKQYRNSREKISVKNLPQLLQDVYPETEVLRRCGDAPLRIQDWKGETWSFLVLPNVVLHNNYNTSFGLYLRICWSMSTVNNLDYIKSINDNLPLWKTEFKELCKVHETTIQKFRDSRLERSLKVSRAGFFFFFLEEKMKNLLLLGRTSPDNGERLLQKIIETTGMPCPPLSEDFKLQLSNTTFEVTDRIAFPYSSAKFHYQDYTIDLRDRECSIEKLYEIDRQLPAWMEEANTILFEMQKKVKAKQIAHNVMHMLLKQKMRELGLKYQTEENENNGNILLTVKLEKKRLLKVTLQDGHTEWVKRQLNDLAQTVNALNSIKANFRIGYQSNNMEWKTENGELKSKE